MVWPSKTFTRKTSVSAHHTRFLEFGVSRLGCDRAQSALHYYRQASNLEMDSVKTAI